MLAVEANVLVSSLGLADVFSAGSIPDGVPSPRPGDFRTNDAILDGTGRCHRSLMIG